MSSPQRVLVTGSRGKVGSHVVGALVEAGFDVRATDIARPVYDAHESNAVPYVQADLTEPGDAYAVVHDVDAVVHTAGIPEPTKNVAHTVFSTNVASTFNVIEAMIASGIPRLINMSSDSVSGMTWAHRPFLARFCPIDESHPDLAHDAYGMSKRVSEILCDGFVARTDASAVSIRPTWVLTPDTYAANLRPFFEDPDLPSAVFWSYIDVRDLADLAVASLTHPTPGHEVVYAAAADNIGGRDLLADVERLHPTVERRPVSRVDASGIDSSKAARLFGWVASRSWRDELGTDGTPLKDARS
ncbi:NAD(P)-dependent oxidoreductase [Microbacterium sp. LRZ72]|uniref:NAD-dependent epimerase/dehydratase family protein n=1 Tax=Microbacterium sp. LRZ72 TaxID=2942481 RepID=UPI0029B46BB6|nr:NAD(P)-dependent oxidoreductase [Microbacterium sp. LRZ72]MDX2376570.1 NAD(P)-dependent oxidoreductase [Microbacterium sp. LRZ72]